ncbi:hypothetical protein B0H15DRAFT_864513 [Mycena belliarum]|uniref:Uncharacterized protein n=1 Tax=Mycena belliarum TaxID=1033014 RepID=A0AAD6XMX3_9AGAR|nr:hypothetical protein B0H15DRAFT_864513 [Mycena belliae]
MSFPAYSDEEEESPTHPDFIHETRQSPSLRTELLSPTSPTQLQREIDRVQHGQRGPSERFRRQREQAYANISSRQLLTLLIEKEYESTKMRKALHRAFDRFEAEASRTAEAERLTHETLNQFRAMTESKVKAERALAKTNEELRLWKFQFDHAQRQIQRAQEVVKLLERQRDDAEQAATQARTTARQLNAQRLVSEALEEGRKLGFKAGFRKAQQEMAYTRSINPEEAYLDTEDDDNYTAGQHEDFRYNLEADSSPSQPARDIDASPTPAPRPPNIIDVPPSPPRPPPAAPPSMPVPSHAEAMPVPSPAVAMPGPTRTVAPRPFETEHVRRPAPSIPPSPQLSLYPISIPPPSTFGHAEPEPQHRPDRPRSAHDAPPRRPPSRESQYQLPPPVSRMPDNYIPSASAEGEIPLPPPFQLSQPVLPAAPPSDAARPQSWYNRAQPEEPAQRQSWYQSKRARSNAGSVAGRSNAGSATGRSAWHARQGSLDSRLSASGVKSQKLTADYGPDLKESPRSPRGTYAYASGARGWDDSAAQGSQRARSVHAPAESLVPPPPPPKDKKQAIADELRYSDPDLPGAWRRDAALNAEMGSSQSRPPRNLRQPIQLTFPAPLSPPDPSVPLGHMRARSMSGSTGKSGWSQPNIAELVGRPSLRRVKEKRPISPSEVGSPLSNPLSVEHPSSSYMPLRMEAAPTEQYLSPNYQARPLPTAAPNGLPAGFVPQSTTEQPAAPVTYKGKSISSPIAPAAFLADSGVSNDSRPRPSSGLDNYRGSAYGGSSTGLNRPRLTSVDVAARAEDALPTRPLSAISNASRKSGWTNTEYVAGPTLTADHALTRQASNASLASMRSAGTNYARYDASTYVDPAYFASTSAGAVPIPAPSPRSRKGSAVSRSSVHSGLEYIGPRFP